MLCEVFKLHCVFILTAVLILVNMLCEQFKEVMKVSRIDVS